MNKSRAGQGAKEPSAGIMVPIPTVLQVLPRLDDGTTARSAINLAVNIGRNGGRAIIASEGGRLLPEVLRSGVEHIEMPLDSENPLQLMRVAMKLARIARREKIDLFHAHSAAAAWAVSLTKRYTGMPFVVTVQDRFETPQMRLRRYAGAVARADHVIAVSNFIAAHATADHGVPGDRLSIVPCGVNLARFNPAAVPADRLIKLARRWLLPDGVPVILMPARIQPRKSHHVLIEALALMSHKPFVCLLAGDDTGQESYRQKLEDLAIERNLGGKVRFVGFCDDMPAAYMLADVVVDPTVTPEAFNLAIAEAQAMGRPVICSDQGGVTELVLPDRSGWLVGAGEPAVLAEAIERAIVLNAAAREAIALLARERVERHFSVEQMYARTVALYGRVLHQHRAQAAAES